MTDERPTRVLWVSPTLGEHFGGPTSTVTNGLIAEHRGGIDVELATTVESGHQKDAPGPIRRLIENGVKVRLFPRSRITSRGEAWGLSPRLALWLLRHAKDYDVLHLQYVWCLTSIVGVIAGRLAKVPVVLTPHESLTDFDIEVASRHPLLKLFKRVLRPLFLRADQLVLMSELERRDTRTGDVPVRIISHAVLEQPRPEREPRPAHNGLRIAFLGRNIEKKGIHLILEAIARQPDRRLAIAGPPGPDSYRLELETLIESLDLADRVEWVGFVDDRPAYLSRADVLAMPSVYEGFGMVAAEAMCVGVPVVVPTMSGVAEIVSEFEAGIVIPKSSADALDRAFSQLESDPERLRELGQNGSRAAASRLSFEAYADQTGRLYSELIRP